MWLHRAIALGADFGTSVFIKATDSVLLDSKDSAAVSLEHSALIDIQANNIELVNHTAFNGASVVSVSDDGKLNLNGRNNITISSVPSSDGYGIQVGGSGQVDLHANETITIGGGEGQRALVLKQTNYDHNNSGHGRIALTAKNIDITGCIHSSVIDANSTNGIFLNASDGQLSITANNHWYDQRYAAINVQDRGYVQAISSDLFIVNKYTDESSLGIRLDNNSAFDGEFKTNAVVSAVTGVVANASGTRFALSGDKNTQSHLFVNGSMGGIISKTKNFSVKDTSVSININKDTDIDYGYTHASGEGVVGLGALGGNVDLVNSNGTDKNLVISLSLNSNPLGGPSKIKTAAITSILDGTVNIENFDNINLDVVNKADKSSRYGLRAVSGSILMNKGIGNVSITAVEGDALYSSSYSGNPSGLIDISSKTLSLHGSGKSGKGINANDEGIVNVEVKDKLSIIGNKAIEVKSDGSKVDINGATTNQSLVKGDWSVEAGKANVVLGTAAVVEGKLQSSLKGQIDLSLDKNGSLQGNTSTGEPGADTGIVNLTMGDSSIWMVTDNSHATALNLTGTTIDFSRWDVASNTAQAKPSYRTITSKTLTGSNDTLRMQIDLGHEDVANKLTDQLSITGKAEGAHIADIKIDGRDLVPEKLHSENWLVSQGAGSNMTITNKDGTNSYAGNGMVTTWALGFVGKGEEGKLDTTEGLTEIAGTTTGVGEGNWYLVRSDKEVTDEVQQITNLGISASQAMSFASELDDLRSRLGEVRYGAQDGLWVRAGHMKQTADGYKGRGFEQKTEDLHIGLDRLVSVNEEEAWLVGGALRYAKSDQEGFAAARGGDGELKQYSAKLYATYMHMGGSYADFVVQAGRYDQDIRGLANDKESAYSADYRTWGYGASIEAGHMFSFQEGTDDRQWYNHAFIEPQVQLSYFRGHGKDFQTSTGLGVSQDDADFLTGRAGVVIGKKFNLGTANDLDRRYLQIGLTGGVKYEFLGDQDIRFTGVDGVSQKHKADDVDGVRYYYGLTADWQFTDDLRAYAQIEREESDNYTKDYDISVGLKYAF